MKHLLWGLPLALMLASTAAQAEIYKWKDKNGVIRYSDIPPPSNVPHESLGKKGNTTPAPVENAPAAQPAAPAQQTPEEVPPESDAKAQEEAAGRKKAEAAEAEQRQKQENCATAQANLANFKQGGRVYKMNEKGEREYLGNDELAAGLEKAQAEVDKYCQ
ncbi:MAG TPA: DUF4124 domain-containing protein [Methylophilaceae bacterium]|nr:DUF4124 domain-containing protein [Methylophilaceae bacterium]